jgi:hypothetical protein
MVARPSVATARLRLGPDMTHNSRRAALRLTPSAWATVANSCCVSGVISTAFSNLFLRAMTSACRSASCR